MTLQYDIDISYVMPPEAFTDSGSAELLKASGFALNGRSNYIAKFRDPQTAAALAGASPRVKAYFETCGFVFNPSGKVLPSGAFDEQFDGPLNDVASRLQENLHQFHLKDQMWNEFDLGACIVSIENAKPIEVPAIAPPRRRKRADQKAVWTHFVRPQVVFPVFAITLALTLQFFGLPQFAAGTETAELAPNLGADR